MNGEKVADWWLAEESGIRTHEGLAALPVFEIGTFNHSATFPKNKGAVLNGTDLSHKHLN